MSCSRTQHGGGRYRTPDLTLRSPTLYHWATALPVTICDVRARDIRIWQINSQNVWVRKIWKTWFLDMGACSWQNATYTIQFTLTIYINSEKLMLPGRCAPVEFFSWNCGQLRKTGKRSYPALIRPFRTSLFRALSWNKVTHIKLQSLKMFKTSKEMFYKQFEFFATWQDRLWGFVILVLYKTQTLYIKVIMFIVNILKILVPICYSPKPFLINRGAGLLSLC